MFGVFFLFLLQTGYTTKLLTLNSQAQAPSKSQVLGLQIGTTTAGRRANVKNANGGKLRPRVSYPDILG